MKQAYQGRSSGRVRDFALFGETTGETDEFGLPVRLQWAAEYRGDAAVVYGHTPVAEARLDQQHDQHRYRLRVRRAADRAALARAGDASPSRQVGPITSRPSRSCRHEDAAAAVDDDRPPFLLDVDDVAGKRIIQTGLARSVTVREENAAAAIEVMSRFAIDPRWLVYLPPTMAPTATSNRPDVLEYPEQAFSEYRADGVPAVICEEKHMGSRAIVIVCRDSSVAKARFGIDSDESGVDLQPHRAALPLDARLTPRRRWHVSAVPCDAIGLWDALATDWVLLDCELMPWSAKADRTDPPAVCRGRRGSRGRPRRERRHTRAGAGPRS